MSERLKRDPVSSRRLRRLSSMAQLTATRRAAPIVVAEFRRPDHIGGADLRRVGKKRLDPGKSTESCLPDSSCPAQDGCGLRGNPLWREMPDRIFARHTRPSRSTACYLFFLREFPWFFAQRRIAVFRESSCFRFSTLFVSPRLCRRRSEPSRKWRGSLRL
jgi:hypothetical protein